MTDSAVFHDSVTDDYRDASGVLSIGTGGGGGVGATELIYRYTVTGSDKASIDTGVDTPDAGSNDWTGGDLLEIYLYLRTDDAGAGAVGVDATVNNDTSSIYDRISLTAANTVVSAGTSLAQAKWLFIAPGNGNASGVFCDTLCAIYNYAGAVGHASAFYTGGWADATANNCRVDHASLRYRSTTALSRFKITPTTGGGKFKVGSKIAIYKRLSS